MSRRIKSLPVSPDDVCACGHVRSLHEGGHRCAGYREHPNLVPPSSSRRLFHTCACNHFRRQPGVAATDAARLGVSDVLGEAPARRPRSDAAVKVIGAAAMLRVHR